MDKHIEEVLEYLYSKEGREFSRVRHNEYVDFIKQHITNQDSKLKQIEEVVDRTIVNDKVTVEDMEKIFNILKGE